MARGKIEIKYIKNPLNRQITYSKRKSGILKKARELTILCNGQVCLIMFSKSGKIAEYVSPSATMKEFFDRYEKKTKLDLWEAQYEALQEELRAQQEIGSRLKKEIRQRTGRDGLSELSTEELRVLEEDLHHSLGIVRNRKNDILTSKIRTTMKSIRFEETTRRILCSVSRSRGLVSLQFPLVMKEMTSRTLLRCKCSQVGFHLQPSQPNLPDAAGGQYFLTICSSTLSMLEYSCKVSGCVTMSLSFVITF
ncbi:hypothetical protein MKW92_033864 [Papaver armeniacum]|nr:hypothetical protein MKW92_033864 [Papaver armeniacum]